MFYSSPSNLCSSQYSGFTRITTMSCVLKMAHRPRKDLSFQNTHVRVIEFMCHVTVRKTSLRLETSRFSRYSRDDFHRFWLFDDLLEAIRLQCNWIKLVCCCSLHPMGDSDARLFRIGAWNHQVSIIFPQIYGRFRLFLHSKVSTNLCFFPSTREIRLSLANLIGADIASASVLISMGALLGRISPIQLLVMGLFEIVLFASNEYFQIELMKANDSKQT